MVNVSTLGQALDTVNRIKIQQDQLGTLQNQLASGKKATLFTGLETDTLTSKRARADIKKLEVYQSNITNSNRRIELMLTALREIQQQAQNVSDFVVSTPQQGDLPDLQQIQDLSQNVFNFITSLMNEQDGDRYLFAGSDTTNAPINPTGQYESFLGNFIPDESDLDNPPLVSEGVIGQWGDGAITTAEFIDAYRNSTANETRLGYSAALVNDLAGDIYVRPDDNFEVDYTVLANTDAFKDILVSLSVIKELPPVEYAPGALNADATIDDPDVDTFPEDNPPFPPEEKQENFFEVWRDVGTLLTEGIRALDDEIVKLESVRAQIADIKESHRLDINRFQTIVGEVEDVDINQIAVELNYLQIQLDATFRVTASVSELSLARFF